ncbi:MAG: PIN domain nuclease [Oligoflexales bacterium]|nr:PIN domain nuclease [Oligoflexales bacterium]
MIIVDSSVWIDYFNGTENRETNLLDKILDEQLLGVLDLIYIEVLQGFSKDKDYKIAEKLFSSLSFYESSGKELADAAIKNFRFLRKKGVTVRKTIDVIIASFCVSHDFSLLHRDKDFLPMGKFLNLKML